MEASQLGEVAFSRQGLFGEDTWAGFFSAFGPEFPAPDASDDAWTSFAAHCSYVPAALLLLGILACIAICFTPCLRNCCSDDDAGSPRRPWPMIVVVLAMVTLIIGAIGAAAFWSEGKEATTETWQKVGDFASDLKKINGAATELDSGATDLKKYVESLQTTCPSAVRVVINPLVKSAVLQLEEYQEKIAEYTEVSGSIESKASNAHEHMRTWSMALATAASVPLALVAVCCIAATVTVLCANTGRCTRACLCLLTPVAFVPTLLLVSAASSAQMFAGVGTSSFCENADKNTLAWIAHLSGAKSDTYQFASFYIKGTGSNPVTEKLDDVTSQLDMLTQDAKVLGVAAQFCPDWPYSSDLTTTLDKASGSISEARDRLSRNNVYPYYDVVVHNDVCGSVIVGLGWLVSDQVLVGLVLLPLLTLASDKYLHRRHLWASRAPPLLAHTGPMTGAEMASE